MNFKEVFLLTYVIQSGDSLWSIASRFGVSPQALAAANQLTNQHMIHVGQTLHIPTTSSPTQGSAAPTVQPPSSGPSDGRIAKLERDLSQAITIVDDHRRQIAELNRKVKNLKQHS
jgi:spore germination protein YaaH